MSDEIEFWTNPRSRGAIAHWMLEEVGAPYRPIVLDYGTTMKAPEYLAINPMGKVPAIRHRGQVVTECAAICADLAETFPDAGLLPAPDRRGMVGYGDFESVVATLAGRLAEAPYRAGERLTAADVHTGSQIIWGLQFGTLPDRPEFRAYVDRIKDRPARARAVLKG